jgi:hypothetical protein
MRNSVESQKFKFTIFPERMYSLTVDDYDGNPYTFEVSGEAIAAEFRREALLTRQFDELYNDSNEQENHDRKV